MPKAAEKSTLVPASKFACLDELHLKGIERQIANGEYVSAEELAGQLRKHGNRPIPPTVLEYLCLHLERCIAKPKGRKALPEREVRLRKMIFRYAYQQKLKWLRKRKDRFGHLEGWPLIRDADWWKGPPNERAARMVAKRLGHGADSWRRIQNEISSLK